VDVHQPELVRGRDQVGGVRRVLVIGGRARADLVLGELVRERAQRLLLLRQVEGNAARSLDRRYLEPFCLELNRQSMIARKTRYLVRPRGTE